MPTYEFRCPKGHDFERFYRTISSGVSELPCPECGEIAIRQLSRSGLVFKGSGFYLTDYGKNAHRGGEKKSEASTADGGKAESKSDSKSDSKSESKSEGKSESGKTEGAKSDSSKAEGSKSEASPKPKAESREPRAENPKKPKSE
jgi:putative FmdB family regulatory protein